MNEFGENLRQLRGTRTKRDFAAFLGVSPSNYQYYENGRVPEPERLKSIADSLGVSIDHLLGRVPASVSERESASYAPASATPTTPAAPSAPAPPVLREPRAEYLAGPLDHERRLRFLEEQCAAIVPQLNDIRRLLVALLADGRPATHPTIPTAEPKERVG